MEPINHTEKEKKIVLHFRDGSEIRFRGWHRQDLDDGHPNWHYYQTTNGGIYHVRKEHIIYVFEDENSHNLRFEDESE